MSIPARLVRRQGMDKTNKLLWAFQGLLALLFLFAGGMKLAAPAAELARQAALPGAFMKFIGLAEVLGAAGLILPGLVRIAIGLTPMAACGLAIIMTGATTITVSRGPAAPALVPLLVGILAAFVAWG